MKWHPEYYERMIAAYAPGFAITESDFEINPPLRFSEGEDDVGVIVSWNIEGPGNAGKDNIVVMDGAISINPINWKRDETYAAASENSGSRTQFGAISINPLNWRRDDSYAAPSENIGSLVGGKIVTPGVADAQVDVERGVVVCTNTDYPYIDTSAIASTQIFGTKSFHGNDYTFYYANIQKNVADRIAAYQAKNR